MSVMQHAQAFIGLGGNIGDSYSTLKLAVEQIRALPGIHHLKVSPFYNTTPVSSIPQGNFTNAVCMCQTTYSTLELQQQLQSIENHLGKIPKNKDAPRAIDLDILFFGQEWIDSAHLQIPHPRWKERLFVVQPLSDLVDRLWVPTSPGKGSDVDLCALLKNFNNSHNETLIRL